MLFYLLGKHRIRSMLYVYSKSLFVYPQGEGMNPTIFKARNKAQAATPIIYMAYKKSKRNNSISSAEEYEDGKSHE